MTDNTHSYKTPHQVLITLKRGALNEPLSDLESHVEYYREKSTSYGYAMNQRAICILLNVINADDFEQIITNDPALISGELEIDTVIPFVS